jgi:hypothetical protein
MSEQYYSEGVGHGGFVGTFATAGSVVLESWNRSLNSSHVINQPDQLGGPLKWAGVVGFTTATAVAQLPMSGGNAIPILLGDTVSPPASMGGGTYVVISASEAFQMGEYWKSNLGFQKTTNS